MERMNIYLEMLHDYAYIRDHYNFWTMEEYATLNDFDWYLSHRNREYGEAKYSKMERTLPELEFLCDLHDMCSLGGTIKDGITGIEHINTRIALLMDAIELLIKAPDSTQSGLVG
jgi:hypothetical protein